MERMNAILKFAIALLLGIIIGAYFGNPRAVKAIGSSYFISVQKVHEGNNAKSAISGSQVIGFACTQEDCYVATTE